MLQLMIDKLVERKKAQSGKPEEPEIRNDKVVSDRELFRGLGRKLKYQGK